MYKVLNDKEHDINFYNDEIYKEYELVVKSIINKLEIKKEDPIEDKIKKVNRYMMENVSIRDNYFHALDGTKEFDESEMPYRTGYAALLRGQAMCAGFTEATRSLLEECGVESNTLITKLPGKNKQLLHYVCLCNVNGKNTIIDPERQKSCEKKNMDFNRYLDGMIFMIPDEYFYENKVGPTGVGPKAMDYLQKENLIYGEGLASLDNIAENIGGLECIKTL